MVRLWFTVFTLYWGLLHVTYSLGLEDAAAGQQRLSSPPDDPVSVERQQSQVSVGSTDIKSCLRPAPYRVRFQKLKGEKATFTRTLLNQGMITTYASNKKTVTSTDIANCLSLADAGGFVGFSFNDGTCYMFNIRPQLSGCVSGGQDVFYVQDSYWAPGGRPGGFSLSLTHGLASIVAKWEPCCPNGPSTAAKFQVSWNNTMIVLNKTTFQYTLSKGVSLCTDNLTQVAAVLKSVTLEAFDDAGTLMKTVTATLTEGPALAGQRYLLNSSNCLYYDATQGATFNALDTFCKTKLYSTMFIEYEDGDCVTFRNDIIAMSTYTPPVEIDHYYVGLRNEGGNWTWQSGLPQPSVDDGVWGEAGGPNPCAFFYVEMRSAFDDMPCDGADAVWVCHDYCR